MTQLRDYQADAVQSVYDWFAADKGNPLVVAPTGCHVAGTMILMADGSLMPVEDIPVGALVMGPDSNPRAVLRLCRGSGQLYKIIPTKGEPFVVNDGHILSLKTTNTGKKWETKGGEIENITVADWIGRSNYWKHIRKLYRVPIDLPKRSDLDLSAYVVGALLGDGCLTRGVKISNPDHEVLDAVWSEMDRHGLKYLAREKIVNISNWDVSFSRIKGSASKNPVSEILRKLGLFGTDASEKFIPDCYKLSDTETRLQVLAGLLDTDGHLSRGGYDYISKSKRLSDDVVFVARSLGLAAYVRACRKSYIGASQSWTYWRVSISGSTAMIPTKVHRKRASIRLQKKDPLVTGFSVEAAGFGEFFGFTLSGDHLYLTEDFTVHHNSGKSVILSEFCRRAVADFPATRIICAAHVKELISQNFAATLRLWPSAPAGIYSAGLSSRQMRQITFAGIQSVAKKSAQFGFIDLLVIDEAHLLPRNSDTQYQTFIAGLKETNPALKVVGLTATPFRLDSGRLDRGKGAIFDGIAYDIPIPMLVKRGYLSPLISKRPGQVFDLKGLHTRAGDYVDAELMARFDTASVTKSAVAEIVAAGQDRRSWLIFCISVEHAAHVRDEIRAHGISAEMVTGETDAAARARILADFKAGRIQALANVNVLTTGFDAPHTDLLAFLRPTQSLGLYMQMAGRGMRIAPGKANCIAEGQRVLTDHGLIEIQNVTKSMKVWDGAEYVSHCGIIFRGQREVIQYAGLVATHDHRVWTEEGWKAFGRCAREQTPIAVTGDGGAAIRQVDRRFRGGCSQEGKGQTSYSGAVQWLRRAITQGLYQLDQGISRLQEVWQSSVYSGMAYETGNLGQAKMHKPERWPLFRIRRARDQVQLSVSDGNGGLGYGEFGPASGNADRPDQQRRSLRAGEFALSYKPRQSGEQAAEWHETDSCISGQAPGGEICGYHSAQDAHKRDDGCRDHCEVQYPILQAKRRVWDILNTGPRNSFTVEGLLVHNCLVLDFAGNVAKHGPVDAIGAADAKDKSDKGEREGDTNAPAKTCPDCQSILWIGMTVCPDCGHEFPEPPPKIERASSTESIMNLTAEDNWQPVRDISFARHTKNEVASLRADYLVGNRVVKEFHCFEHTGYPRQKAVTWWNRIAGTSPPASVAEALMRIGEVRAPEEAVIVKEGEYWRISRLRGDARQGKSA